MSDDLAEAIANLESFRAGALRLPQAPVEETTISLTDPAAHQNFVAQTFDFIAAIDSGSSKTAVAVCPARRHVADGEFYAS